MSLVRSTAWVSIFTVTGQIAAALSYSAMAAMFGRGYQVDGYLAGTTLPRYAMSVFVAAWTFVLVPTLSRFKNDEAGEIGRQVVSTTMLISAAVAALGVATAERLIAITTPGLSAEAAQVAVRVAWISWPGFVAACLVSSLSALENVEGHFVRPAVAVAAGSLLGFGMMLFLAPKIGAIGIAIAMVTGTIVQFGLLASARPRDCRLTLNVRHPAIRSALGELAPLAASGVLVRATPVFDRYLVSQQGEGSIAALGYADSLSRFMSLVISSSVATVVFPRMARAAVGGSGLGRLVSGGLRMMWFVATPIAITSAALAVPLIQIGFQRGQFGSGDTQLVAWVFQIYLAAFVAFCLGNISGRALFALRLSGTVSLLSSIESIAYFGYATLLVRGFGLSGVAIAFTIYCAASLSWQYVLLARQFGAARVVPISAYLRTLGAAGVAGAVALIVGAILTNPWAAAFAGSAGGLVAYFLTLRLFRSREGRLVRRHLRRLAHQFNDRRRLRAD